MSEKKSGNIIGYGEEKLYCPSCRCVLIRNTNTESSNFHCIPCRVDWMITDSKGIYVLSAMMGATRERITMAERGLRTKNDNIRIDERSKTAKAIFDEELFRKKFTKTERESLEKKYGV